MTEVNEDFAKLEVEANLLKHVRYYLSGEIDENVLELLRNAGAERMNYFSDYVTHLICGNEPEDTDLTDAIEVYEIPAVTTKWVLNSCHLKRSLSTKPYLYNVNKLFSNLNFCFSSIGRDRNALWAIVTYNGGCVQLNLNRNCNYLVTTNTFSEKYLKAQSLLNESILIVTPDWILESVRNKCFARVELYHPRLILWPKIIKHESTTAITGFEPDELGLNDGNLENILPDSTQALLEELKQRMPWNQPQTSPSSDLAPPNVIAPSYTGSKLSQQLQDINQQQSVQQRLFNQQQQLNIQKSSQQSQQLNFLPPTSQVPRSIVHHPPQSPLPQNQQLQFPVNQQVAFSQANLTSAQRLKIIEQMQQHRAQRLQQQQQQQNQFNQLQQQQRVQQLQQQVGQLQQENQMGQVNQQQQQIITQVNQLRQPVGQAQPQQQQQVAQGGQQQLILTGQNQQQENPRQLLQNIQQGQQQQLVQNQQLRQVTSQQVTSMAQLQMVQNQQQQHSNLNQLSKSTPTSIQSQQQLLSPQQLLQRQIQNQHLLKSQHILQNQQQQLQNQLNQQSQINQQQQGQQQQNQINQQLLQTQQPQDLQQQLSQQSHLEQQLTQQNQLNQQPQQQQQQQQQQITQNQLNQRQLNQLNQHLLQNQLVQQNQQQQQNQLRQSQISVQQQQLNQLSQQQINQNRLNIQQQQQNKILQSQFNQQQQQQIINQQQTVVVPQNQQNVLQQQFGSPTSQQFNQQQTFVQQAAFNQPQQPQQQLIQAQQSQQQVIACQQQQQVQVQQPQQAQQQQILAQQQQLKPQQIIGQPQLVNQKLNIQQIGGQQHILLQQPQQVQTNQESSPQRAANAHLWQQQQQPPPPPPTPQQQQQSQINIQRHPNVQGQGPRLQWAPNQQGGVVLPQRQYIHLDEQTHQQLQQMSPEDRALFVQKLHKHRQQVLQSRMQAQQQQRAGHILIRGGVPLGLNSQQQMQWLQQQAKQQGVVLQQNIQQAVPQGTIVQQANPSLQHAPGLSPIQQQTQFTEQNQQLQLQRQQQQQLRLQQLQLHQQQQREQAQKSALQQQQPAPPPPLQQPQQPTVVRALVQGQVVEGAGVVAGPPPVVVDPNVVQSQNPLVVNSKTKTALANMLNTRLQSGGSTLSENIAEPSAAGTLKLMTAQHNAALNTGTRPHDLLFFQQRRIINRPNGEVIRPPPATSVPPGPQVDPPKLQYSPRNSVPLQHRPGTYYGHNPNLKLPPDLFLLGCVFVVVELERFLDESMPGWQKKIEKHGGEIEKQYCNRVTHVICETQRHGVVMQALRDFKRCVTLYWLSDVINRKQVLPPWIALHLPTMYWDTAPASKHLICLTGFQGTERDRVKHMIKYIGAGLTTYFSKHNTLLITTKGEGPKYHHAKKWGIPIVNVQWLTDIMLGHFTALNQTEHVKYQHFVEPPNFSFDPLLVPNLMHAWKMPINISQESYEKVKRSASPVVLPPNSKAKKIKTELVSMMDENDNDEDMVLRATATYRILFSMCPEVEELKKIVRQLGGIVVKSFHDCTHLLMPQLKRTHKLLCCLCIGTYIIPDSWLKDSYTAGKFLDESNYSHDTKEFNSEFKCDFNQTISTNNRNKLFEGKHFFVTPSVVPRKKELIELIECSGGMVEKNRRTLAQIEATNVNSPYSYVILTHENDLHLVADLLKNKKDKIRIVCNSELILSAILKQTFEVEPYAVKFL